MSRKIPDEDTVVDAIKAVMNRTPHVDTQRELALLVRKELRKKDPQYSIGAERVRRLGIDKGVIKLTIEYHETNNRELPDVCPVCGNGMRSAMNKSFDGDMVEVRRNCSVCPYSIGQKVLVPGKYSFSRALGKELTDEEMRIRKLEKAKGKLREASRLINDALHMSNIENRSEYSRSAIDDIIDSDDSGSIRNLILDLKDDEDSPGWTRPTVSVKNTNRKDI